MRVIIISRGWICIDNCQFFQTSLVGNDKGSGSGLSCDIKNKTCSDGAALYFLVIDQIIVLATHRLLNKLSFRHVFFIRFLLMILRLSLILGEWHGLMLKKHICVNADVTLYSRMTTAQVVMQ